MCILQLCGDRFQQVICGNISLKILLSQFFCVMHTNIADHRLYSVCCLKCQLSFVVCWFLSAAVILICCNSDMAAVAPLCNCVAWQWCPVYGIYWYILCVCWGKWVMCYLDNQAIVSAGLMFAHGTISIKIKWMLALSIIKMNVGVKCSRHCSVNHIFKIPEFISPWNLLSTLI